MEPTLEIFNLLKREELSVAAVHYGLEVPENASKAVIKKLVLDYLVEEELIVEPKQSDTMKGHQLLEVCCRVYWWKRLGKYIQLYLWRRVLNMMK